MLDVVKLDRSFLAPIIEDATSQALVSLVLGLAGPLRMDVIVEGVETPQQRDVLVDLGCHRAQGFLFARPSTGATIRQLLTTDRPLGQVERVGREPAASNAASHTTRPAGQRR